MSRLTVLQVHNRYREAGGEDTVVRMERDLLRLGGHRVIEFTAENPRGPAALRSFVASAWNPVSARRIGQLVDTQQPDVAHVHNTWWQLTPSILKPLEEAGIPVVMTLHNYRLLCANAMLFREGRVCEDCIGTSPWRAVPHRCYRNSMFASAVAATAIDIPRRLGVWDDVDLFISLTEFARERFVAGGLPATKLLVKPNFVDDPGPRPNLPSTSNTVLFVGRLSTEKGVRTLLEAWHSSDLAGLELLVVGDGPLREELESTAPRGVRFAGRVAPERVSELMLRSRGMVFPSVWYEGQPMVLLEALAAGLPVVASDIGGIPETVAGHSVLVAPGDRTSWTRALERLADAEWVDSASAANRAVYESRYAPEVALGELEGAYRRAREERGLRP